MKSGSDAWGDTRRELRKEHAMRAFAEFWTMAWSVIGVGLAAFVVAIPTYFTFTEMREEFGWSANFEYWFFVLAILAARMLVAYIRNTFVSPG